MPEIIIGATRFSLFFQVHPETYDPMIVTIGRIRPSGICGSGLISIVSGLLECGVIDQQGKFNRELATPRIREGEDGDMSLFPSVAEKLAR